jgi:hypothetical protein
MMSNTEMTLTKFRINPFSKPMCCVGKTLSSDIFDRYIPKTTNKVNKNRCEPLYMQVAITSMIVEDMRPTNIDLEIGSDGIFVRVEQERETKR